MVQLRRWSNNDTEFLLNQLYSMIEMPESTSVAISAVSTLSHDREYDHIDQIFQRATIERLHVGALLGFLRSTSAVRDKVPHWEQFRSDVKLEINNRDLDAVKLMVGLFD